MAELAQVFTEAAVREFAFLGARGFSAEHEGASSPVEAVSYRSPAVLVELLFGSPEFEPELVVTHLQEGTRLNSGELIAVGALSMPVPSDLPKEPTRAENVAGHLRWLAGMLQVADARLLAGDPEFHRELSHQLERYRAELKEKERVHGARAEAQEAWHSKNYKDVIRQYESIRPALTLLEQKRLAYALEQEQSL